MYRIQVGGFYVGGSGTWTNSLDQASSLSIGDCLREIRRLADPESKLNHLTIKLVPERTHLIEPTTTEGDENDAA